MIAFVLLRVFLILLLVAANAFFAAAEFALVSVRDTRIQQLIGERRIGARTVLRLHQHLDEEVNGVQLGITLTSLTLGWIGEPTRARIIEPLLGRVPHAAIYAHSIGIVLTFTLITYLHVILGELVVGRLRAQKRGQRIGHVSRLRLALREQLIGIIELAPRQIDRLTLNFQRRLRRAKRAHALPHV